MAQIYDELELLYWNLNIDIINEDFITVYQPLCCAEITPKSPGFESQTQYNFFSHNWGFFNNLIWNLLKVLFQIGRLPKCPQYLHKNNLWKDESAKTKDIK